MIKSGAFPSKLLLVGLLVLPSARPVSASVIIASQDHTVRRGPSIENNIHIKQSNNNSTDRYAMFRFDSSEFGADVTSATFLLTANSDTAVQFRGTFDYRIYGVPDGTTNDEEFVEGGYNPALGSVYDGSGDLVDAGQLMLLGDANNVNAGDTISFISPSLLSFIQADANDVVTLVVTRITVGDNSTFLDRTTGSPPRLDITSIPEPASLSLLGLYALVTLLCYRRS